FDAGDSTDITIDCEKLQKFKEKHPQFTPNEWEYIQTGFVFYQELLNFNGFCLHSSAVALENRAILFSGPCGTGKSTHTSLWQQYFGPDKAVIINDDKPALRLMNDTFYVYGTPWSGKSSLNINIRVPLKAIVFLKQEKENYIRRLNNKEAVHLLIYQSIRPQDCDKMDRLLTLLDLLLPKIPVYQLGCTISMDAVKLVHDTLNQR
ncbi:MAG: hypothetical protein PHT62_11880, partial [Desulfotomaculaceae bacterium]|nr:hypothetical protein [Desulfotomaculaceae bacterium]